jgi:acylphosphatase
MAYRLSATVHGHVQGVGFRYWVHHTAQRLGVTGGAVRNTPDGTVAVEAEADSKDTLQALFVELHKGPAAAQVTQVEAAWDEPPAPTYASFRVA